VSESKMAALAKKLDETNSLLKAILKELKQARPQARPEATLDVSKQIADVFAEEKAGPYAGVTWEEFETMKASERKDG
jgi:hypothetical protein